MMELKPADMMVSTLGECRVASPLDLSNVVGDGRGDFVPDSARVLYDIELPTQVPCEDRLSLEKAGPRERLFFEPAKTKAAIVTCGGLCPGLNNVIRSTFLELHHNYGVPEVLGIRYGYQGFNPTKGQPPVRLTPEMVDAIHKQGGTILGSSRGPEEASTIVEFLQKNGTNLLFCVGGDGTQHGAHQVAQEVRRRGLPISVIGIPKTIDNDLHFVTRTFGYATALEVAREVIDGAHMEARGAPNGVGLVKLMGREAGFIAAGATLASQEVNFTLVPEVAFPLTGPDGFLEALKRRILARQHAVVVVAEGAGQHLMPDGPTHRDASGNLKLRDIGVFLSQEIQSYFAACGIPLNLKYLDPSYFVRSVSANCDDSLLSDAMARNAVHAAMAGKTDVLIGWVHDYFVHVPITAAIASRKRLSPESSWWLGVLSATGQPSWGSAGNGKAR